MLCYTYNERSDATYLQLHCLECVRSPIDMSNTFHRPQSPARTSECSTIDCRDFRIAANEIERKRNKTIVYTPLYWDGWEGKRVWAVWVKDTRRYKLISSWMKANESSRRSGFWTNLPFDKVSFIFILSVLVYYYWPLSGWRRQPRRQDVLFLLLQASSVESCIRLRFSLTLATGIRLIVEITAAVILWQHCWQNGKCLNAAGELCRRLHCCKGRHWNKSRRKSYFLLLFV